MAEGTEEITEESGSNKIYPILILILLLLVVLLIVTNMTVYLSYVVSTQVATREVQQGDSAIEAEKKTLATILLPGDNKDKSFNAFIARGEEQGNLAIQIRMSLGISNPSLAAVIQGNSDPIRDRILAYMSQKTKRDIIYAFQRKVLGEELKEIINAILEYDLKVDEVSGRVTKVHVTKLLFINM